MIIFRIVPSNSSMEIGIRQSVFCSILQVNSNDVVLLQSMLSFFIKSRKFDSKLFETTLILFLSNYEQHNTIIQLRLLEALDRGLKIV